MFMLTPKVWSTGKMISFELESHVTQSNHPKFLLEKKGNNVFFKEERETM